jgi:ammonium transporter, Amt family
VALCTACIFLIPLAIAGLALINTGLGRSRSAAHSMLAALCVVSVAAVVYAAWGFAVQGVAGGPAHLLHAGGKAWSWIGSGPILLRGVDLEASPDFLIALLQMFSVALAATIPLGSGAERWRLGPCCVSTAILAGFIYPLFAHWVWGGGWLSQLGANAGLGRGFLDAAGGSTVQAVGGVTALAIAWILGSRHGKYASEGMPAALPGHNIVLVLSGCLLAWVGWMGLNCAGTMLMYGASPAALAAIAANTTLPAAAAVLTSVIMTRARFGKPDASLSGNAWMGGLVASSAGCALVSAMAAIVIGAVAGAIVTVGIEWLDRLEVDDPGGSIAVHALGGLWGVLAVGVVGRTPAGVSGQWLAQLVGMATIIGVVLPLAYLLNWILNLIYPNRVALQGEREGMDLHELGAGAYPEAAEF